ncbi:MAG: hypothetical protein M1819_001556 [Sarea resinae]|nr:MAG: hypothetical protein M1819_001556 [Sarea resinae]
MSMTTTADVPLLIASQGSNTTSSERRVTPAWSLAHFKTKLEPITGIPPSCQRLTYRAYETQAPVPMEAGAGESEDDVQVGRWALVRYGVVEVTDTRPPSMRGPAITADDPSVEKYRMPESTYEALPSTVLSWKKSQKLGRFDPKAPVVEKMKVEALEREVVERGIRPSLRCRLIPSSTPRHGTIRYVGPVPELPGLAGPWVGVELDEPTGRNDGSIAVPAGPSPGNGSAGKDSDRDIPGNGEGGDEDEDGDAQSKGKGKGKDIRTTVDGDRKRYFSCAANRGVFVRPERVEVGDWGVVDEFEGLDEEDEEI